MLRRSRALERRSEGRRTTRDGFRGAGPHSELEAFLGSAVARCRPARAVGLTMMFRDDSGNAIVGGDRPRLAGVSRTVPSIASSHRSAAAEPAGRSSPETPSSVARDELGGNRPASPPARWIGRETASPARRDRGSPPRSPGPPPDDAASAARGPNDRRHRQRHADPAPFRLPFATVSAAWVSTRVGQRAGRMDPGPSSGRVDLGKPCRSASVRSAAARRPVRSTEPPPAVGKRGRGGRRRRPSRDRSDPVRDAVLRHGIEKSRRPVRSGPRRGPRAGAGRDDAGSRTVSSGRNLVRLLKLVKSTVVRYPTDLPPADPSAEQSVGHLRVPPRAGR